MEGRPTSQGSGSTVALIRCPSYDATTVERAMTRGVELLGGIERFVRAGETVLLKPNLLMGRDPSRCVTTHPNVFRAAAIALRAGGAYIVYGDSPGFGRPSFAAQRAGLADVAAELGIPLAEFSRGRMVSFPEGRQNKQFTIADGVLDADGLVSLCKMKTHGLTRITGAIKNQFGCIPGPLKAEFHARLPTADLFSQMLVDLNRLLKPRLYVMDGIVAMEGNGPSNGQPRSMNVLLLSTDPVALDATVCRLIALDPDLVLPIRCGAEAGLGSYREVDLLGDPVESFVCRDFAVNRHALPTTEEPGRASRWARRFVVPKPVIRSERCTHCGTCVSICPVEPKALSFRSGRRSEPPVHDYDRCIRCYCCQELCPEGAIEVDTPWVGRLLHR